MQKLEGDGRRAALSFEPFAAVKVVAFEDDARWERSGHGERVTREYDGGKCLLRAGGCLDWK